MVQPRSYRDRRARRSNEADHGVSLSNEFVRGGSDRPAPPDTKKADVAKNFEALDHIGLLADKPPGMAGLLFSKSSDTFDLSIYRSA